MADTSHLHPDVVYTLRNGKLPPHWAHIATETEDPEEKWPEQAERLRAKYRQMVQEQLEAWEDDHPGALTPISAAERAHIESVCNQHIQHEWRLFRLRQEESADDRDGVS